MLASDVWFPEQSFSINISFWSSKHVIWLVNKFDEHEKKNLKFYKLKNFDEPEIKTLFNLMNLQNFDETIKFNKHEQTW